MDPSSIAQPKTPLVVPSPAHPRALLLAVAAVVLLLVGPGPVEAQRTTCTRIGNMVTCDTPTIYPGQPVGAGPALNGFVDGFLRADEKFSRQPPQPPVIIIQPPAPAPATAPAPAPIGNDILDADRSRGLRSGICDPVCPRPVKP